jgi:hypothetical protein
MSALSITASSIHPTIASILAVRRHIQVKRQFEIWNPGHMRGLRFGPLLRSGVPILKLWQRFGEIPGRMAGGGERAQREATTPCCSPAACIPTEL